MRRYFEEMARLVARQGVKAEEKADGLHMTMDGVLFCTMVNYCLHHGGHINGGWTQCYGYVAETDRYRFCLRCIPVHGDYNAYLTAFDLREQEMNMREHPMQGQQMI